MRKKIPVQAVMTKVLKTAPTKTTKVVKSVTPIAYPHANKGEKLNKTANKPKMASGIKTIIDPKISNATQIKFKNKIKKLISKETKLWCQNNRAADWRELPTPISFIMM